MLTSLADNAEFPSLASTTGQQTFASRAVHDDSRQSTPPIPPGFEGHESRRGTPTVPPGLSRPTALPDLGVSSSRPGSRPSSRASVKRTASQILPALPLRPGTPGARGATPSRQGSKDDYDKAMPEETPTKSSRTTTSSDLKIAMSAQDTAPGSETGAGVDAANDDREEETASVVKASADAGKQDAEASTKQAAHSVVTSSETPVSSPNVAKSTPAGNLPRGKGNVQSKSAAVASTESPKRKHPGKIEIPPPGSKKLQAGSVTTTPADAGTSGRSSRALSQTATTSKLSESPMPSPALKAPRTLRLTTTPKAETPPSNAAPVVTLPNAAAHRFPSRQPSVSSINHPGTPCSDHISVSDNISLTSTTQSRANSPPPVSRVGSAPVRDKTKSQQKKDRQIRAKQLEEAELAKVKAAEASKLAQDTEQEAVVSRMKKSKKEKAAKPHKAAKSVNATTDSTPTVSRPPSPGPKPTTPEVVAKDDLPSPVVEEASEPATPAKAAPAPSSNAPAVQPLQSPHEPSPPPTPTLTPAQLIAELKHTAPEFQRCIDALFKVQTSHHFKTPLNISPKELANSGGSWKSDFQMKLSKDDVDALLEGRVPAIHYGGEDNRIFDRGMVSPSGAHLRALTKELESRFLELEKALRDVPEELRFRPTKPQNDTKLPTIDLEALKQQYENSGRGPSVMEQMVQDGSTMKKGAFLVDEASKYINEFVMPPATPPPSTSGRLLQQGGGGLHHAATMEKSVPGVEITERLLSEAKRQADERESALRKVIKKNKKAAGVV